MAELVTYLSDTVVKAADHLILAGDFNVDPRDNEDTLKSVRAALTTNTQSDAEAVDPSFVTWGTRRTPTRSTARRARYTTTSGQAGGGTSQRELHTDGYQD